MIAVLGAGPHGQQLAALHGFDSHVYDDNLPGYDNILTGAASAPWIVGAAWPKVRRQIAAKAELVHVHRARHRGVVVFPGSQLGQGAFLGDHVHVGFNAVVAHGCRVGDFVTICPGAVLSGEVTVEDDVFIGANATIIHGGITIGAGAIIGAGAVVIDNVPPGAVVAGVPARKIR